ncbi:MFS transporter [Desulfotomaculum nigrificans]|uniref:MFS transporter n=1 Tax=Desulfotomaculum nigrificans TaxID=1565 RepID=UPI0001FAE569|nr:MFS transporter [Desulfotomaculum nigrificans]
MTKGLSRREEVNLLSRLDRIPITGTIIRIMTLLVLAWIIEAFDIGIVGQTVLVLKKIWHLSPSDVGLLGTSSTLGIVIGVYFAGRLMDKFGRKKVLVWGVAWFAFFTGIGALFANLYWVVAMRFIAGLGEGAVFPIPYLLISEFVGAKRRGTIVSWQNAILCAAYVLPSIVGAWALTSFTLDVAWRIPFIIGAFPIFYVIALALWLPESPRWLLQQGRIEEVKKLVAKLENEAGLDHDENLINPSIERSISGQTEEKKHAGIAMLFKKPYLSRSLVSWGLYTGTMICWYAMLVYAPTIFAAKGFEMKNAVLFTGTMMVIGGLGEVVIGYLSDAYGRKPVYLIFSVFSAVGMIALAQVNSLTGLFIGGFIAAFFGFGTLPMAKIYIAEQYPTYLRGAGSGVGEAVARLLGGVLVSYYISFILAAGGVKAVFWFVAAAFIFFAIPLMIWGQETAGLSVEETGSSLQKDDMVKEKMVKVEA